MDMIHYTNMHALTWQVAGRPTRSTVQRALLSGKAPVDRTERLALCILASVDRPVDWWHNGLKYDRWPVDRQLCQTPTASFSEHINWEFGHCFSPRFLVDFEPVFPTSLKEFSPQNWELILPIKRGVYQEWSKEISWVFPPPFSSLFSHTNTWATHWLFIL